MFCKLFLLPFLFLTQQIWYGMLIYNLVDIWVQSWSFIFTTWESAPVNVCYTCPPVNEPSSSPLSASIPSQCDFLISSITSRIYFLTPLMLALAIGLALSSDSWTFSCTAAVFQHYCLTDRGPATWDWWSPQSLACGLHHPYPAYKFLSSHLVLTGVTHTRTTSKSSRKGWGLTMAVHVGQGLGIACIRVLYWDREPSTT